MAISRNDYFQVAVLIPNAKVYSKKKTAKLGFFPTFLSRDHPSSRSCNEIVKTYSWYLQGVRFGGVFLGLPETLRCFITMVCSPVFSSLPIRPS